MIYGREVISEIIDSEQPINSFCIYVIKLFYNLFNLLQRVNHNQD